MSIWQSFMTEPGISNFAYRSNHPVIQITNVCECSVSIHKKILVELNSRDLLIQT